MAVIEVGYLNEDDGNRRAGTGYAIVTADSFEAAAELRHALGPIAGLSEAEWRSAWFETTGHLFAICIYPPLSPHKVGKL